MAFHEDGIVGREGAERRRTCPVCGADLDIRPAREPEVRFCSTCGLGYTCPVGQAPPRPPLSAFPRRRPHPGRGHLKRGLLRLLGRHGVRPMRVLPPAGNGRALDLGCGEGYYVRALADLGWTAWGVEVDRSSARQARQVTESHVCIADAGALPWPRRSVSLVSLWHVLEHVAAPNKTLAEVRRVLTPGGILLLEVPNVRSLQARVAGSRWLHWDLPRHRWHFHARALRRLLEKSGFVHIRVWTWPNAPGWVDTWAIPRTLRGVFWLVDALPALMGRGGVLRATARVPWT